ncbi:hypothetical protein WH06_08035 [Aeromonas salmonicida subsp. salmonicida]|uniref:Uncharacterized protein n=1 Tax=Aeromonas salmonicida subsp. salmonicida 01-B526 TaxID=1076135 RepID=A0ABP2N3W9_AERSS|nr:MULTISPECIES: hypothetical protein [Aeromonas]AYO63992.1 hypothetical protein C5P03_15090 [Aeromonas salmonicida subsp. salmonicida 01-B526]EHI53282.1 hypothetical protein IYQ_06991 [Aeromonas salmonicida subsp. salmonicida 01-B526]EKP0239807.1 hypothetical protein [Aeromonas salmonicida]EKP0243915.1 hypothetical protein [Aeromonas salmonicida]EKP0252533.1 hypothetical protein [Aeromonas salmonicida]
MAKPKTPPFTPRHLTPEEIESLRRDRKSRHEANMKALETMDLSRLMPTELEGEKPEQEIQP